MEVPLKDLWCQCGGQTNATPHYVFISQQMAKMHEDAYSNAVLYVCVVLAIYVLGLAIIIARSGQSERNQAMSTLCFCFTPSFWRSNNPFRGANNNRSANSNRGANTSSPGARHSRLDQQQQQQQLPLQQQPRPQRQGATGQQQPVVFLVVPDDDNEISVSMVTSMSTIS